MPLISFRAIRREDGRFEALEPVDVPVGAIVQVTFEVPIACELRTPIELPTHPGTVIGELTRREIYEDI